MIIKGVEELDEVRLLDCNRVGEIIITFLYLLF